AEAVRDFRPGIPQLLTSVPSLSEAASYISESTSIFTRCWPGTSIRSESQDENGQEMLSFISEEA
ncbi:hypothetical protein M569_04789, partial [Genlisea aurea]